MRVSTIMPTQPHIEKNKLAHSLLFACITLFSWLLGYIVTVYVYVYVYKGKYGVTGGVTRRNRFLSFQAPSSRARAGVGDQAGSSSRIRSGCAEMSLNRHSTPPGGVRNPIDSPPPRAYAPPIAPHWAIGVSSPDTTRRSSALSTKSALFLRPASRFMAAGAGTPQGVPVPSVRSANPASAASQRLAAPQAAPVLDTRSSS